MRSICFFKSWDLGGVVVPIATAMATGRPWSPGATDALLEQLGPWSDSRFHRLHSHSVGDGPTDAVLGERIERLHIEPRVFVTGAIEHVDAKRQVVAGEAPRTKYNEVLGADAVPRSHDRPGVGELAHLNVGTAVAQKFDALRPGARMSCAVHHQVRAKAADDVADSFDPCVWRLELVDVHCCLGAEAARQGEPRGLRRADADHATGSHLLRSRDSQNSNRSRALDDDSVPPLKAASTNRSVEGPDARGQRLGQCAEAQRHVVRQLVDLGSG